MVSPTDRKNNKVNFRLPPAYMEDLIKRTAEREAPSIHLCAREIYMHAIANNEIRAVRSEMELIRYDFQNELRTLRNDFVHLAANLFVNAGKLSASEATRWVEANFGGPKK